jgi:peptidoglycan/LPS O-acetylase OafA/YrhL
VAWAFLAFALLLNQVSANKVTSVPEVVSCLLFYRNFAGAVKGGLAGHFWSLSLEEQFYLVWPCVLLLSGFRRSRWIAAAGAIGCAGYRWLFWSYYDRNLFDNQSQVRADALLVGCLLALLLAVPRLRAASVRWSRVSAIPALLLLLFCVARFHWLAPLCECIAIAALIAASTLNPHSVFARPLTFAPFTALGIVSYSIYVWQQPFMMPWPTGLHLVLLCLVLPLFVLASYYGIERPCMRFGHRITNKSRPPASPVPA